MVNVSTRGPGWTSAVLYALALHAALIAFLVVGFRLASSVTTPEPIMQATVVREAPEAREQPKEPPKETPPKEQPRDTRKEQEEQRKQRQREEEERRVEEQRKKQEVEQAQIALERKKLEEKKKLEEARKKEEAEQKKKAEVERKKDEERKKVEKQRQQQAEETMREQMAEEEKARAAARTKRLAPDVDKYRALIAQHVERRWVRPQNSHKGLKCTVVVRQAPGGEVLEAHVVRTSGDTIFDRSVESAVRRASPLPAPDNPDVFDRDIEFIFNPAD